jgi:hypothetical protein
MSTRESLEKSSRGADTDGMGKRRTRRQRRGYALRLPSGEPKTPIKTWWMRKDAKAEADAKPEADPKAKAKPKANPKAKAS